MNVKQKGNTFERKICEQLSLWLTGGQEGRGCWRSDTSGAAATILARKGKEKKYVEKNAGDIRQVLDKGDYPLLDNFFETFVVECKHYKKIEFYPPMNGTLRSFMDACIAESETTGKKAILILRANNRKIMLFSPNSELVENLPPSISLYYQGLKMDGYILEELIKQSYKLQPKSQ